jgi:hypothetical protein
MATHLHLYLGGMELPREMNFSARCFYLLDCYTLTSVHHVFCRYLSKYFLCYNIFLDSSRIVIIG